MSSDQVASGVGSDPAATFATGMAKAKAYVQALRELGDPPVELIAAHPIIGAGFVFYKDPAVQAGSGFKLGCLEILSLLHSICLTDVGKGCSLIANKTGYPLIEIDEDVEFSAPATSTSANVRAVDLDGGDPADICALIMRYARAAVQDDFGLAESDTAICNKYFQFEQLVGGMATRDANFRIWAFTMFQALRLLALSPTWLDDEKQRPLYTLKKEFNGAVDYFEKRVTDHFDRATEAIDKAPKASKSAAGLAQALLLAGTLGKAVRGGFSIPLDRATSAAGGTESPPSKKQRMSDLLGARSVYFPARVSDTKAGILGPKLLRSVVYPFERVTLVDMGPIGSQHRSWSGTTHNSKRLAMRKRWR